MMEVRMLVSVIRFCILLYLLMISVNCRWVWWKFFSSCVVLIVFGMYSGVCRIDLMLVVVM